MRTAILLTFALAVLFASGCTSEPPETTVKLEGLERVTHALQSSAMLSIHPASIQMGEKSILYVPEWTTRNGDFFVQYRFYELVDGQLKQIGFGQPSPK